MADGQSDGAHRVTSLLDRFKWVGAVLAAGPPGRAARVAFALADCCRSSDGACYPSYETLSERTGIERSNVGKGIRWLESNGLLTREEGPSIRGGRAHQYHLILPKSVVNSDHTYEDESVVETDHTSEIVANESVVNSDPRNGESVVNSDLETPESVVNSDHQTSKDSNQERKNNQEESRARGADGLFDRDFDQFWSAYPHKVGKEGRYGARHAFQKALKKAPIETILGGLARYVASKPADRPWCNPATWLNQERWSDEPAPQLPLLTVHNGGMNGRYRRRSDAELAEEILTERFGPQTESDPAPVAAPVSFHAAGSRSQGASG